MNTRTGIAAAVGVAALSLFSSPAHANPEMCDYQLTSTYAVSLPCTLKGFKVVRNTVFYKGGYADDGWTSSFTGGFVSKMSVAKTYVPTDSQDVAVYAATAPTDLWFVDIRDPWTMKALYALSNAGLGGAVLKNFVDNNDSRFGFFVKGASIPGILTARCDRNTGSEISTIMANFGCGRTEAAALCKAMQFSKLTDTSARDSTLGAAFVSLKTLAGTTSWTDAQALTLYRLTGTSADHQMTQTLCPYLAKLGFHGWYGAGASIPTSFEGSTMLEEYYVCWGTLTNPQIIKKANWATAPVTTDPAVIGPSDVFPASITKIPTGGSGVTLTNKTATASTTRPSN